MRTEIAKLSVAQPIKVSARLLGVFSASIREITISGVSALQNKARYRLRKWRLAKLQTFQFPNITLQTAAAVNGNLVMVAKQVPPFCKCVFILFFPLKLHFLLISKSIFNFQWIIYFSRAVRCGLPCVMKAANAACPNSGTLMIVSLPIRVLRAKIRAVTSSLKEWFANTFLATT